MIYRVQHVTTYVYSQPVSMCHNEAHLTPGDRAEQSLLFSELSIDPPPEGTTTYRDYFGNDVTFFTVQQPHEKLVITAESLVEVRAVERPVPPQSTAWKSPAAPSPWNSAGIPTAAGGWSPPST